MTGVELSCSQAIFTSVRTPMGEGYRLIAVSKGVRASDKQIITRVSPSHESLCLPGTLPSQVATHFGSAKPESATTLESIISPSSPAVAFYPSEGGRLCVSTSCHAGAEHTGRGGQRVFTRVLTFHEADFARIEYNPMNVVRAMIAADLTLPDLKPPAQLPELTLSIQTTCRDGSPSGSTAVVDAGSGGCVLRGLFDSKSLIVNVNEAWTIWTEAMLLALPGPLRSKLSLSAGLRFSTGRSHRLQVLHDEKSAARTRTAGTPIEYVDTISKNAERNVLAGHGLLARADVPNLSSREKVDTERDVASAENEKVSTWQTFVARYWSHGDLAGLSRRTSRAFEDVSPTARERIGRFYLALDEMPSLDTSRVLATAVDLLGRTAPGVEGEIVREVVAGGQRTLLRRFNDAAWKDVDRLWPALVNTWRQSPEGTSFAQPLIGQLLRAVARKTPVSAAEAALEVALNIPPEADAMDHNLLLDEVLERFAKWLESRVSAEQFAGCGPESEPVATLRRVVAHWRRLRVNCSIVRRIIAAAEERLGSPMFQPTAS